MVRALLVFNQEGLKADEIEISGVIRYNMALRKGIIYFVFFQFPAERKTHRKHIPC